MSSEQAATEHQRRDDEAQEYMKVLNCARRLISAGVRAGRRWDAATTVGEVAKAVGFHPDHVIYLINTWGWLMEVVEDASLPREQWVIYEDGE